MPPDRERVPRQLCSRLLHIAGDVMKEFGLIPHRSTHWPLVVMLPAFCPQIAPSMPVLPVVRLISTVPSIICGWNYSMAWKRSSDLADAMDQLKKIKMGRYRLRI